MSYLWFQHPCRRLQFQPILPALDAWSGEIYNLWWVIDTSVIDTFVKKEITGYGQESAYDPPELGESFRIYYDANKVRRDLGWKTQVPVCEGLEHTVGRLGEGYDPEL